MKLSKTEQTWLNKRKKGLESKSSQPLYTEYGAPPKEPFSERMKKVTTYYAFSKERKKLDEEFVRKYGRGWWIFHDCISLRHGEKYNTWIMQFKKGREQENS
tara:strand:+ start:699 stop:1004 length:306 start_codon:yes stop_codon:yes gene_type:complete